MAVEDRTFTVEASGSTDAVELAKAEARAQGLRISTVCSVSAPEPSRDPRTDLLTWRVTLAVKVPA